MSYHFEWVQKKEVGEVDFSRSVRIIKSGIYLKKPFVDQMNLKGFPYIKVGIDEGDGVVALLPMAAENQIGYKANAKKNSHAVLIKSDSLSRRISQIVGENPLVSMESYDGGNIAILKRNPDDMATPKAEEPKEEAGHSSASLPRRGSPPKNPPAEEPVEHEACKGCRNCYKGKPCNVASFRVQDGKEVCSNWWEKKP
jgi:hypothetical protein